LRDS
jgi:HAD superfamily hydrolase (TIGR01509 family)